MIKLENVFVDVKAKKVDDVFNFIGASMEELNLANAAEVVAALQTRESEGTTAFVNGIAIPHGKLNIPEPIINIVKFKKPIKKWESMDGKPVEIAINILVPTEGAADHLTILSTLSRKFVNDAFIEEIKQAEKTEAYVAKFDFLK